MQKATNTALLRDIGGRIRAARKASNLTQEALAERIDVQPATLSRVETGHQTPSLGLLAQIAEDLGVELRSLLGAGELGIMAQQEIELVQHWRSMDERGRETLLVVAEAMSRAHSA